MKPTKNRVFCRECGRMKMLFEEEKQALGFLKSNSSDFNGKVPTRAYYCDACFGWHITSKKGDSYKNPLTDILIEKHRRNKNKKNRLKGVYNAEVTECFTHYRALCCGVVSRKKTLEDSKKRLELVKGYKEQLCHQLSTEDFEIVEKIYEEAVEKVAKYADTIHGAVNSVTA